jgi:hypothetical protein
LQNPLYFQESSSLGFCDSALRLRAEWQHFEMTALLEVSMYEMERKEEFSPALLKQVLR